MLLQVGHERVDQAVDRLAVVLRDLRERFAALELGPKLILGQAEIGRGRVELAEEVAARAEAVREAEEWHVAGLDPRLELVALRLRDLARRDGCVYPVLERLLEGVAQGSGRNAELLRGIVDDRLALLLRRAELVGSDRAAPTGDRRGGDTARDELPLQPSIHCPKRTTRACGDAGTIL